MALVERLVAAQPMAPDEGEALAAYRRSVVERYRWADTTGLFLREKEGAGEGIALQDVFVETLLRRAPQERKVRREAEDAERREEREGRRGRALQRRSPRPGVPPEPCHRRSCARGANVGPCYRGPRATGASAEPCYRGSLAGGASAEPCYAGPLTTGASAEACRRGPLASEVSGAPRRRDRRDATGRNTEGSRSSYTTSGDATRRRLDRTASARRSNPAVPVAVASPCPLLYHIPYRRTS